MIRRRPPRLHRRPRTAFSLLEVLLALSLGIVLLTAIGAAVDQAWRLSAQGQTDLQRQQVARAVLRIIEQDLRSVMFVPPSEFADPAEQLLAGGTQFQGNSQGTTPTPPGGNPQGGNQQSGNQQGGNTTGGNTGGGNSQNGGNSNTNGSSSVTDAPPAEVVIVSRGVRGDAATLEIDGSRAQRELAFVMTQDGVVAGGRTSDLRTMMYLVAGPNQVADPLGRGGLVRREGDRYAIESAELQGQNANASFQTALLAPEIIGLQFRYFDGVNWQTMWDSTASGRLPRAVEVQLQFAPAPTRAISWLSDAGNRSTQTVRLVVHLPAADPVPEEIAP